MFTNIRSIRTIDLYLCIQISFLNIIIISYHCIEKIQQTYTQTNFAQKNTSLVISFRLPAEHSDYLSPNYID